MQVCTDDIFINARFMDDNMEFYYMTNSSTLLKREINVYKSRTSDL